MLDAEVCANRVCYLCSGLYMTSVVYKTFVIVVVNGPFILFMN
jgi:hypothetical protein